VSIAHATRKAWGVLARSLCGVSVARAIDRVGSRARGTPRIRIARRSGSQAMRLMAHTMLGDDT